MFHVMAVRFEVTHGYSMNISDFIMKYKEKIKTMFWEKNNS